MKAHLVFIDESGFFMAPLVRRTWAPCGKTPVLYQRTRSHEKVSIIAAVSVSSKIKRTGLVFSLHSSNITTKLVIRFLKQLTRHIHSPIVLVWDRLLAHRAKATQQFLKKHKNLHVYYLPPYAPELNPVEFVWAYLKQNPLANYPLFDKYSLNRVARYHTSKIKKKNILLRSFLYATPLFLRPK